MSYIGLLALGIFVGTLLCIAVRKTTNWSDAVKVVVALLGAALSGAVFTFIEWVTGGKLGSALYMYPVGLAWSLLFLYADEAVANVTSTNSKSRVVGWLHMSSMVLATVLVLLLLFSNDFRKLLPPE
jgi:hypothetical protein